MAAVRTWPAPGVDRGAARRSGSSIAPAEGPDPAWTAGLGMEPPGRDLGGRGKDGLDASGASPTAGSDPGPHCRREEWRPSPEASRPDRESRPPRDGET